MQAWAWRWTRWVNPRPVLLFQMGRVGSKAVFAAVSPHRLCVQTHTFNNRPSWPVRDRIEAGERGWKVITLVRDPIARNISTFFKQLENSEHAFYVGTRDLVSQLSVAELIDRFLKAPAVAHDFPLTFFSERFARLLRLNPLQLSFSPEQGWQRYQSSNAEILLIRSESLMEVGGPALDSFLGLPYGTVRLRRDVNASSTFWYSSLYRRFIEEFRAPASYLQRLYDSAFAKTFYSEEERERLAKFWSRPLPGLAPLSHFSRSEAISSAE